MRRLVLSALLFIGSLVAPVHVLAQNPNTAVFPGSVAGDTDLFVAHNKSQSTLSTSLSPTDTSVVVADGSTFTAPVILTVENEVLHCTTLSTNTFSGCSRGQEGTTASSHTAGAGTFVYGLLTAYQMNQALAEIKAIETNAVFGGVVVKTGSYTATSSDNQKVIVMECSSACTLTLPSSAPVTVPKWSIVPFSLGTGVVTVSRNGLLINTASSNFVLNRGEYSKVDTDGTNYFARIPDEPDTSNGILATYSVGGKTYKIDPTVAAYISAIEQGDVSSLISTTGSSTYSGSFAGGCSTTALKSGMWLMLNVDATNSSGSATLNVCSTGNISIKTADGYDPFINIIPVLTDFPLYYNGTNWIVPDWIAYSTIPERFVVGAGGVLANSCVITDSSNPTKVIASTGSGCYGVVLNTQQLVASGTYTSGISATGTVGQTCQITSLNGGGSGATATVALTGTNTIAGGTALVVTSSGNGYSSAPTSGTAGNGSASCSGTAVISTTVSGGIARVVRYGKALLLADNTVTANDLIINGTSTVTYGKDSAQTSKTAIPATSRVIGKALSSTTSGNTFTIELSPDDYGIQSPGANTGTSATLSQANPYFICTGACTITVPVPTPNQQYCVFNGNNVSTVITLSALGSSARYENQARTAYGTAGTGTMTSGGAVKDGICILGLDSTHYLTLTTTGVWTAN